MVETFKLRNRKISVKPNATTEQPVNDLDQIARSSTLLICPAAGASRPEASPLRRFYPRRNRFDNQAAACAPRAVQKGALVRLDLVRRRGRSFRKSASKEQVCEFHRARFLRNAADAATTSTQCWTSSLTPNLPASASRRGGSLVAGRCPRSRAPDLRFSKSCKSRRQAGRCRFWSHRLVGAGSVCSAVNPPPASE